MYHLEHFEIQYRTFRSLCARTRKKAGTVSEDVLWMIMCLFSDPLYPQMLQVKRNECSACTITYREEQLVYYVSTSHLANTNPGAERACIPRTTEEVVSSLESTVPSRSFVACGSWWDCCFRLCCCYSIETWCFSQIGCPFCFCYSQVPLLIQIDIM